MWEYLQNLPLGWGLILGHYYWIQENYQISIILVLIGCLSATLLIRYTESHKTAKDITNLEDWKVTLTNFIIFSITTLLVIAYLISFRFNWYFDFLLGAVAGLGLSIFQSLSAKEKISWNHNIAFMIGGGAAILLLDLMINSVLIFVNLFVISLIISILIALLDYRKELSKSTNKI
jgi:hypothetical protein